VQEAIQESSALLIILSKASVNSDWCKKEVDFGPNPSHFETYSVGSFLFVPANVEHTMAADEDTILIGTAVGPWATHHHDHQDHQNH
jgi:hypothetical protein